MSNQKTRITATTRTKLIMLFAAIQADVPNKTIEELHKLACDLVTPTPVAKSTVQAILKHMGLVYKAYKTPSGVRHGTLQRDTLRAVCAWIVKLDNTVPEDSLIYRFTKP